jgi:hypothetical protein
MVYFNFHFSDNPLKCVNYAGTTDSKGESYLLKCRVILGDQKVSIEVTCQKFGV